MWLDVLATYVDLIPRCPQVKVQMANNAFIIVRCDYYYYYYYYYYYHYCCYCCSCCCYFSATGTRILSIESAESSWLSLPASQDDHHSKVQDIQSAEWGPTMCFPNARRLLVPIDTAVAEVLQIRFSC